jgi:hypothetical protein
MFVKIMVVHLIGRGKGKTLRNHSYYNCQAKPHKVISDFMCVGQNTSWCCVCWRIYRDNTFYCCSHLAACIFLVYLIKSTLIRVITKLPNSEHSYKEKVKTHNYINRQNQSTTETLWKRNDPDSEQAFLKKWWVESDFKAPNLPLSLDSDRGQRFVTGSVTDIALAIA